MTILIFCYTFLTCSIANFEKPTLSRIPTELVSFCRSLPAKSTRLSCDVLTFQTLFFSSWQPTTNQSMKRYVYYFPYGEYIVYITSRLITLKYFQWHCYQPIESNFSKTSLKSQWMFPWRFFSSFFLKTSFHPQSRPDMI